MLPLLRPFFPTTGWQYALIVPLVLWTMITTWGVIVCRDRWQWPVAFTRKLFHAVVFTSAGVLQLGYGLAVVSLYGIIVVVTVLIALVCKDNSGLYRALARPKDQPRAGLFVLLPMIATGAGGVLANGLFGNWAVAGYLFCGLGDAVAEPIGEQWGDNPYRVPGLAGVTVRRTIEGSAGAFLVGTVAVLCGLITMEIPLMVSLGLALAGGITGTALEALSHHGLDNFTLQVGVSGILWWLGPMLT